MTKNSKRTREKTPADPVEKKTNGPDSDEGAPSDAPSVEKKQNDGKEPVRTPVVMRIPMKYKDQKIDIEFSPGNVSCGPEGVVFDVTVVFADVTSIEIYSREEDGQLESGKMRNMLNVDEDKYGH